MQTQGGIPAEEAIAGRERRFRVELKVDWNRDGLFTHPLSDLSAFVDTATVDRSLRGTAPEEVLLIEGASAAELVVRIDGEYAGMTFDSVFSPYQGLSPLYRKETVGAEITYRIGVETSVGVVWYPQFVGSVRTITPVRGEGDVEITALDRVELLRRPVTFPAWSMYEYQRSVKGRVLAQLADPQWFIDHCLRGGNVSATPYRPTTREEQGLLDTDITGPQLWVNGTGSYLPTIGWLDNWTAQDFPDTENGAAQMYETLGSSHPNSPEPSTPPKALSAIGSGPDHRIKYWAADRDQMNPVGTQVLGFTLVTRGTNGSYWQTVPDHEVMNVRIGFNYVLKILINAGTVRTEWLNEQTSTVMSSGPVTIPTGGDYQRVIAIWDVFHAGGPRVYLGAGINNTGFSAFHVIGGGPATPVFQDDFLKGLVETHHKVAWNDLFYTATNLGSTIPSDMAVWAGKPAKYAAVLDSGLNRLSFTPLRRSEDAWDLITSVASAEFGAVFWDESGVFRFWNYNRLRDMRSTIVRTLTLDDVSGLEFTTSLDSVRNIYSVTTAKRSAYDGTVFDSRSEDEFYCPAVTQRKFPIWEDTALSINPGKVARYSTVSGAYPAWDESVRHGYVVQWLVGGVWAEDDSKTSGVDIFAYHDRFGGITLRIYNGYSVPARLCTNSGSPALKVLGTKIDDSYAEQVVTKKDAASVAKYNGRNFPISGEWYQEFTDSNGLIDTLMPRTTTPAPSTDAISMAGDPRTQLGDTLRIVDADGFGERFDVQIYGIMRSYSRDDGLKDTLTVEVTNPPLGIWDSSQYGLWDNTFVWSS